MLLKNDATYKQLRHNGSMYLHFLFFYLFIFYFGFPLTQLDSFWRTFSQTKSIFKINFANMKQK